MVSCNNCQREVTFILKHLAKSKYCKKSYSEKDIHDLKKASREKTLTAQRAKQNQSYDSGKRSERYHEEKQKKSKTVKRTNSNTVTEVKSNFIQSSNEGSFEKPKNRKVCNFKCSCLTVKQNNSNAVTKEKSNFIQSSNEDFLEELCYVPTSSLI